jgi:hypothetical protein
MGQAPSTDKPAVPTEPAEHGQSVLRVEQIQATALPVSPGGASFDQAVARLLPLDRMQRERDSLRAAYAAAKPYPHIVVDGFFDEAVLDRIVTEFPKHDGRDWISWDTRNELKQTSRGIGGLSPFTQLFFMQLCSEPFLEHIRYITGFPDLVLDPLFHGGRLRGTGCSPIQSRCPLSDNERDVAWLSVSAHLPRQPHAQVDLRLLLDSGP